MARFFVLAISHSNTIRSAVKVDLWYFYEIVSICPLLFDHAILTKALLPTFFCIFLTNIKCLVWFLIIWVNWLHFIWNIYIYFFVHDIVACFFQKIKTVWNKCLKAYLIKFKVSQRVITFFWIVTPQINFWH